MRGSGWALPAAACAAWMAAVAAPAAGLGVEALLRAPAAAAGAHVATRRAVQLVPTSLGWAALITLGAVLAGWLPGRALGAALRRRAYVPAAALMLAPICVPAYVIFYAWWQAWPADSALHRWVLGAGRLETFKALTLLLGFVCWSWPIVAWCVAGSAAAAPAHRRELLLLDGAGPVRRLLECLRCDARGLGLGALVVFLFTFGNTTSFDIAQVFTFGYELKAIDALSAGPRAILRAAAIPIAAALVGAAAVWWLLGRRDPRPAVRPAPVSTAAWVVTAAILVISVAVPMLLFARNLGADADLAAFADLYGGDVANTALLALGCGAMSALVAAGLAAAWQDERRWVRGAADVQAVGWLATGIVPGTIVGVALEAAYNRPGLLGMIYDSPAILMLGHLARFGLVGALLARWVTLAEPAALGDLRRLEGGTTLGAFVAATWPRTLAAGGAAFAVTAVLSMSELAVTARVGPPGFGVIARGVLNAVHYQRPDTVLLATLAMIALGLGAGAAAVAAWAPLRRLTLPCLAALLVAGAACCGGCDRHDAGGQVPLATRATFGSPGMSLGQFNYPRGIAVDRQRGRVYVVDKTARVQRYDLAGRPQLQWRMPEWDLGKPTGLGVAPDGRVFVADTHYHRVIAYDGEGRELRRWGAYGQGPGQFIYPTDVAFGPDGRVYVSEYGGSERISVFSDAGEFLFAFGSMGHEVGQFNRPQSMTFNADLTELFVADACNHRIVVLTPEGRPLRVIGGPGRGPGQLAYPYDVMMLDDGTLLVCEFGNNRIQRFSAQSAGLGTWGVVGAGPGQLQYPWGIDGTADEIYVLDSGNNRVQVIGNKW